MKFIHEIQHTDWNAPFDAATQKEATEALEGGLVLFFPNLTFKLSEKEVLLRDPRVIDTSKNVNYNPASDKLGGTVCTGEEAETLKGMISRFASQTKTLLNNLFPHYSKDLAQARTSFRPVEVAGRNSSWRKDDTRLHVDSFPSSPTQGKRILRIFSNVNPQRERVWRVGEPFEEMAKRFFPKTTRPAFGSAMFNYLFRITKAPR
ncbi:MAG TPA: Kdo hydroxylase family protein, partial [Chthoniobacteraceae bacterium]|nr:Kdo hydroxylase family protein [Chthoniobacteraceae bacterium]